MKRKLSTREKAMIGLLAVAGVIAYRALSGDGIGFGGPASEEGEEARVFGEPPVVRMDLLAQAAVDFDRTGRNLFDYYTPPPPPKPPPPPRPKPKPAPRRPRPAPPPPPAPRVAQAPTPPFQYLGYLGPKDEKIAVFDDGKGEGVMLARVGDVVQSDFQLLEFKHDSVMMAYTDQRWKGQTTELKLMGLR
jgi:hypothetical protein